MLLVSLLAFSCKFARMTDSVNSYPSQIGDIEPDSTIDDPTFLPCKEGPIRQYYEFSGGLMYGGEKYAILESFKNEYKNQGFNEATGYLIFRFVVNCNGQTGRFRVTQMDNNFKECKFSADLVDQMLGLVKRLDKWGVPSDGQQKYDYYQYLTFKLERGEIAEIVP